MPIPCQIDQYIQILWDTFVHPETSCAGGALVARKMRNTTIGVRGMLALAS